MNRSDKLVILLLTADPSDATRLRLGQELRDIREKLQLAKTRENFELEMRTSIRPGDLTQAIFDTEPHIVHFAGHGTSTGELCLENEHGTVQTVPPDALAALFELVSHQVHCVVLNACYSEIQARAIAKHIDYVVGMHSAIGDKAAISFAVGFYKALGAGYPVEDAYKFGLVELRLSGIPEHLIPVLVAGEHTPVPSVPNGGRSETQDSANLKQPLASETVSILERSSGTLYKNVREAWRAMKSDCQAAETISIVGIRGLSAFGTDQSLVSLAEMEEYRHLRKLRVILLSEESRWLNPGYVQLRAYESIDVFKKELKASHDIIESAMAKLGKKFGTTKSGVRYYLGEPKFGMVITDKAAYINSYAEPPSTQVVDLPIYRFGKLPGSLYAAFKRHFDDLWHNQSEPGRYQKEHIDLETSAGGIVLADDENQKYVALLRRHDGYLVLPKGHRMLTDNSLEETARREVIEETGLKAEDFFIEKALGYYTYDEMAERFNTTKVNHLFLMRCRKNARPALATPEFAEARWWNINVPLPEMLYTYQKSYLHEVISAELQNVR
jgi:8-oxo-dGTP pyrophosphatase MutT (NUDIX family)